MNIGRELLEARQRAGKSREQVSRATKIQLPKLEALEEGELHRLPGGIYLDGIVRAYAKEVGIDAAPLVERARAEYAALPTPSHRPQSADDVLHRGTARGVASLAFAPTSVGAAPPVTSTDHPPAVSVAPPPMQPAGSNFDEALWGWSPSDDDDVAGLVEQGPIAAGGARSDQGAAAHVAHDEGLLDDGLTNEERLDGRRERPATASPPRRGIQRGVLPLLALLAAFGLGFYLYSANSPFVDRASIDVPVVSPSYLPEGSQAEARNAALPADANADRAGEATRTGAPSAAPQPFTEQVLDQRPANERLAADRAEQDRAAQARMAQAPAAQQPSARGTGSPSTAAVTPPATRAGANPVAGNRAEAQTASNERAQAAAVEPSAPAAASVGRETARTLEPENTTQAAASGEPLEGSWELATRVESANYKNFEGLRLGYRVQLQQDGNRITGTGQKLTENGRTIGANGRTPITIEGTTDGRRLSLRFMEAGARRASAGVLNLEMTEEGLLRGRFSSDAARSVGSAEARPIR